MTKSLEPCTTKFYQFYYFAISNRAFAFEFEMESFGSIEKDEDVPALRNFYNPKAKTRRIVTFETVPLGIVFSGRDCERVTMGETTCKVLISENRF
ncbi:MAG: hypothetical protein ACUZ8H_05020 [Candidatus Anammoxibacter sp.]